MSRRADKAIGLDLNIVPPYTEEEEEDEGEPPAPRFGWLAHAVVAAAADAVQQQPATPPAAVIHDTASFVAELMKRQDDGYGNGNDTRGGKRKRADEHRRDDGGDAAAADRPPPQAAERTIERYYDHAMPADKRTKHERGEEEEEKEPELYNGFEVVSFQVVCPIASFKIRRKKGEALKAAIEQKQVRCRIPPFEDAGLVAGVLMADGEPKPVRSPHEIVASSCSVDIEAGQATFNFSEGFRFNNSVEFDIFFFIDAFEELLCAGLFSASTMQEERVMCEPNFFMSIPMYDGLYTDLDRYELKHEDTLRRSRAVFSGRVLAKDESVWVSLLKAALPIFQTSLPAAIPEEMAIHAEEEIEEEIEDDDDDDDDDETHVLGGEGRR